MSYDPLTDREKKLFLDIACFFVGMEEDLVVKVLEDEDSAFHPALDIQDLVLKGLVSNVDGRLSMNHAIEEMGQEIVRQENENEPGRRTRLWDERDVLRVLTEDSGTESVESIRLYRCRHEIPITAFRKMSNLRLIKVSHRQWSYSNDDDMRPVSLKRLKYLEWPEFPLKCINIDMDNVVVVRLRWSKLEILWEGIKSLKKLRILDVNSSGSLIRTGKFHGLENLEELNLRFCKNLKELHKSVDCLKKLVRLDLYGCQQLERFPSEAIGKLRSLRVLSLSYCDKIGLERDEVIDSLLSSLKECHITWLGLNRCNILKISGEIGGLTRLEYLDLSGNGFPSLPDSLGQLHQLKEINLSSCASLQSIPNLPRSLTSIKAAFCTSLANLPSNMSELELLTYLYLYRCSKLGSEDPECLMKVTRLTNLLALNMGSCNVLQVPSEFRNLVSLQYLDLSGNTFSSLPDSFSNLLQLSKLKIDDCSQLQLLPLLPPNLKMIEAHRCSSLAMNISCCPEPIEFSRQVLQVYKKPSFSSQLQIFISGAEVPKWCSYQNKGRILSFEAPRCLERKICGMILCVAIPCWHNCVAEIHNKTKEMSHCLKEKSLECDDEDRIWFGFFAFDDTTVVVEAGDNVELVLERNALLDNEENHIQECGLCLIYEGDEDDEGV